MRNRVSLLFAVLIMSLGVDAQSLVFHYCGGSTATVTLPATISVNGGKIVVSNGSQSVEILKDEVLTVSYRSAQGDVNGDERIDIGDVATILKLIADSSGQGSATDNAPAGAVAVDMGFDSGVKWANMNVGAQTPEDNGLYFAWGETTGYTSDTSDGRSFNWAQYKWTNEEQSNWQQVNKYQVKDGQTDCCWYDGDGNFIGDGQATLLPEDDAATQNWGTKWRIPTLDDIQEILDNTTYTWTTQNGVNGGLFTSKKNGASIFIPAVGFRYNANLYKQDSYGFAWGSSVNPSNSYNAHILYFSSGTPGWGNNSRDFGYPVRPVSEL